MNENRKTFQSRLTLHFSQKNVDEIMFAYDLAKAAHRGQFRASGPRYFEHKRECALIIMDELNHYNKTRLIAILLHDTGEDTEIFGNSVLDSYKEFRRILMFRVSRIFGMRVAKLVLTLTRPKVEQNEFFSKEMAQEHYLQNIVKNSEACWLKMVDLLHNLRSLEHPVPEKKKNNIIRKAREIYAPILKKGRVLPKGEILYSKIQKALLVAEK